MAQRHRTCQHTQGYELAHTDARVSADAPETSRGVMRDWSVERWIGVATLILSGLGFTFGLGVNWAHITEQDARQKAFEAAAASTFVRQDVYTADKQHLTETLERLNRTLEQMQAAQRNSEPPHGRMFDR